MCIRDRAYLSKQVRKQLDAAGFPDAKIYASNDLDENTILNLKMQKAKIDVWGVGTKLITAYDQPALGAVYKIVSMEDDQGVMHDTIKSVSYTHLDVYKRQGLMYLWAFYLILLNY